MTTKVILVEDDEVLRKGLAEYLRLSGLDVTEVASGIELYRSLRTQRFDVAILDVNLPDTTGFALARDLRAEQGMGIIIVTARTGRSDRLQAYEQGADLFLAKPVDGAELVLAIRNLAARLGYAAAGGDGGWTLNTQQARLTDPGGTFMQLTAREVLLLELLAEAGSSIASRAQLESALGYDGRQSESRGLDAMVRRLRAKAQTAGMELPLQVVRSVGLRMTRPVSKV